MIDRRPRYYVLDGKEPRPVTMEEWVRMFERANRHVARTEVRPGVWVSTVFLGIDHNWFAEGPPVLFESMVFTDYEGGDEARRYSTWAEAEEGHLQLVDELEARLAEAVTPSRSR